MRFHCVMVMRDEQDIVEQILSHLLSWADGIYILDVGSTDGTWEKVQEIARQDKRVVPLKQEPFVFNDGLRGWVFEHVRDRFEPGDWVLRADSDEFYHITPPDFVRQRLRRGDSAVWLQWYYFRLLKREVDDYESGRVDVMLDRRRPIEDRRRFYKISQYSEPRMFRYRRSMKWPETASFPYHAGFIARERIPIRHYPHRDSLQMQARFNLRARIMKHSPFGHWKLEDWHDELVDDQGVAGSSLGTKRGLSREAGVDTGDLHFWEPGTSLPDLRLKQAPQPPIRRLAQRIVHPLLLPILDLTHPSFNRDHPMQRLPAEVQRAAAADLSALARP